MSVEMWRTFIALSVDEPIRMAYFEAWDAVSRKVSESGC